MNALRPFVARSGRPQRLFFVMMTLGVAHLALTSSPPVAAQTVAPTARNVAATAAPAQTATTTPSSPASAPTAASAEARSAEAEANTQADPHGGGFTQLVSGSPFASASHRHQAELLRAGRINPNPSQNMPGEGIPAGTLGMLLRDGERRPLANAKVRLLITQESIADGDKESVKEAVSDEHGRIGFVGLNTDSSFRYEAVVEQEGARYSTGAIRLRREHGHVAVLHVFPKTENIEDTFVITRMLYALQPREDIFQVDTILRIQNGGTKTWSPKGFYVQLPPGASAFRPPRAEGDIRTAFTDGRVHISGSFAPGQHELSFGFQLPNPRTANIDINLHTVPHLTDARVFLEATETMGFSVEGLRPAERTRGQEGQNALMAAADFLGSGATAPPTLRATITGMPPRGNGNIIATVIATAVAMLGVAFAVARPDKGNQRLTDEDRVRAKELLLDELVALESAFREKEVGPRTYEHARKTLLDSIARLEG